MWHLYRILKKFIKPKDVFYCVRKLRNLLFYSSGDIASPFRLQIEPVSQCNLQCDFCVLSRIRREKKYLSVDHIRKIVDESGARWIQLSGVGETFLHPDIIEIMRLIKARKRILKITTNGLLLNREICRAAVDAGVDYIDVSIDTTDETLYREIRGGEFPKIIENISYLRDYRNQKKAPLVIGAKHVYNHKNIGNLRSDIERLVHSPFDDAFFLWIFDMYEGSSSSSILPEYLTLIHNAMETAKSLGRPDLVGTLKIFLENYTFFTGRKKSKVCFEPLYAPYVTVDGDMIACCKCSMWVLQSRHNLQSMLMGNVLETPFMDVWNGKAARRLRCNILENRERFGMCATCEFDQHVFLKLIRFVAQRIVSIPEKVRHA